MNSAMLFEVESEDIEVDILLVQADAEYGERLIRIGSEAVKRGIQNIPMWGLDTALVFLVDMVSRSFFLPPPLPHK